MKKISEKQETNTVRELDAVTIGTVAGGGLLKYLVEEFAGDIAYGAGYVFGGAVAEYAKHPPAWDNGKI